jgi:SAM-dependent methyltransferase
MDPENFWALAAVEQGHFWFVPRNRLLVALILFHFPRAESFLEVGCGTGTVLSAIKAARPWSRLAGGELHPAGLKTARERLGDEVELVQMDARAIPAEQAFDVVGAFDVIEHIAEDTAVLRSMHRAVRDGGGIVVAVPQHPWLWSPADDAAYHVRRYERSELERKVSAAGFRVAFSGSYTSLLLPLMMASRALAKRRSSGRQPAEAAGVAAELNVPTSLNHALMKILQLEVSMTLAGIRFPFGGSRVIVARKM